MKDRRAQSISINTIVVAAIALIVLLVVIAIFVLKVGDVNRGFQDCGSQGGECQADICNLLTQKAVPNTNCERREPSEFCCLTLLKDES